MNKLSLCLAAMSVTFAVGSAQDISYAYIGYGQEGEGNAESSNSRTYQGFRLDANAGLSFALYDFDAAGLKVQRLGVQAALTPSYVASERSAIGLSFIYKRHTYEHAYIKDQVDLDMLYIGPQFTWMATPSKNGSFFLDVAMYYASGWEKGRRESESDPEHEVYYNKLKKRFDSGALALSGGYTYRVFGNSRAIIKLTWVIASGENVGGLTSKRNLSTLSLTTGFWLFK